MSSFSGLNTAYTGLTAARAGMNVVGQNLANVNTAGYTRQRLETSSIGPVAEMGMASGIVRPGNGVSVDGIARLNDLFLDSRVRQTAAQAAHGNLRAETMRALEDITQEPGDSGLSARLQDFWASWQDMANQTGEPAPAAVLLQTAGQLADQLARGYREFEVQWDHRRAQAEVAVSELNNAARAVAELNEHIRVGTAVGTGVNELLDERNLLTTRIAELAGGTVKHNSDGTVDVVIGGGYLVRGDQYRALDVTGATAMESAQDSPVTVQWRDDNTPVAMESGHIAGALSVLRPAQEGGAILQAAADYDNFARTLAEQVNAVHREGATPDGSPGGDFFGLREGVPAAKGLTVLPTSVDGIAAARPGAGGHDGSNADAIAQLGNLKGGPNTVWGEFITRLATATRTENDRARLSTLAADSAAGAQLAGASVDMDEENLNLLAYQRAYQASARMMTAVDEALDTLINRTGVVGR